LGIFCSSRRWLANCFIDNFSIEFLLSSLVCANKTLSAARKLISLDAGVAARSLHHMPRFSRKSRLSLSPTNKIIISINFRVRENPWKLLEPPPFSSTRVLFDKLPGLHLRRAELLHAMRLGMRKMLNYHPKAASNRNQFETVNKIHVLLWLLYLSRDIISNMHRKKSRGIIEGCEDPFNRPRSDSSADDNECVSLLNASLLCKYFVDYHCARPRGWKKGGKFTPLRAHDEIVVIISIIPSRSQHSSWNLFRRSNTLARWRELTSKQQITRRLKRLRLFAQRLGLGQHICVSLTHPDDYFIKEINLKMLMQRVIATNFSLSSLTLLIKCK
jgi:hypothetical protein